MPTNGLARVHRKEETKNNREENNAALLVDIVFNSRANQLCVVAYLFAVVADVSCGAFHSAVLDRLSVVHQL